MRNQAIHSLLRATGAALICSLAILLGGCSTGYRRDGNGMLFVTLDEGTGYGYHRIPGADPSSFVVLKDGYAKDKGQVYFDGKPFWSASLNNKPFWTQPVSFVVLSGGYAKDDEFAYYRGKSFQADLPTFHVGRSSNWAVDKNDAYIQIRPVHACDPGSFEYLDYGWFRDNKCVYSNTVGDGPKRVVGADPKTFTIVNYWFGVDEKYVYTSDGAILKGVDAKSFLKTGRDAYLCLRANEPTACYRK